MKKLIVFVFLAITLSCSSAPKKTETATAPTNQPSDAASLQKGTPFFSGMRQITFEGTRSGEGYFSADGRYMIFQSEREKGNPFYQIYMMDMKNGATHRVSPGNGKTTCSWINPDLKHVLFASTHADPHWKDKAKEEYESRKHPSGKYAWSFDDQFDIYESDFNGGHLKNLTHSPGYDAEGSYSPDGKWIAFASNRAAYTGKMTEEEKKNFARDPSYMMDIYIMRSNGTGVKRLTDIPGYDGGPFFSPDGTHITFRHFRPDGMMAEIYTMKTDGSEMKQLTHLDAMSWASFYHPSGDYLIFATNKQGMSNFELYMVDTEGKHEAVRLTDLPGFDGLPVFTPDGKHVVWAHANDKKETQLYEAEWNDLAARQALGLGPAVPSAKIMSTSIDPRDAKTWVYYLASDHLEGRPTGTPQENDYLATITKAYADMGLKPVNGSYLQEYEFTSGIELSGTNDLQVQLDGMMVSPQVSTDWIPLSYSKTGKIEKAAAVFAGYGIVAPKSGNLSEYDSYSGLDVKGKWAVVFSGLPDDVTNERRFQLHTYSLLQHKAMMARVRGAVGLIVVEDTASPIPSMTLKFEGRGEDAGIPVIRLSPALADKLFASEKSSRKEWTTKLAKGDTSGFSFTHAGVQADVGLQFKKSTAHNALAMLQVPGAKSTLVIGAHGDHLGHGQNGNSLWRGGPRDAIHYGADDNASGVAGVMTIARAMTEGVKSKALNLKQNVLFAVWTGEEIGILGSTNFVNTAAKNDLNISAYLNMDMIGRYRDYVLVQGTGSAPEWRGLVENAVHQTSLAVRAQDDPYLPSDAMAFYMKKYPTVMFFTGSHPEYHTPKDRPETVNYDGLAQVASLVENMAVTLASSPRSLVTYQKVETTKPAGETRGFRLYLGTVPDYTQEGKNGVVISGTSKDSPAEKAGLKTGDTIIELGGMKIKNIYDYVYCLQAMKANVKTPMRIVRDGKEQELQITPMLKE